MNKELRVCFFLLTKIKHDRDCRKTNEKYKPSHLSRWCLFLIVNNKKQDVAYKCQKNLILVLSSIDSLSVISAALIDIFI